MAFLAAAAPQFISTGIGLLGAERDRKATSRAAAMAGPQSYNVSSPFGTVDFNPGTGATTFDMADNPFADLSNRLSQQFLGGVNADPMAGLPPELVAAFGGADSMAGDMATRAGGAAGGFYDALAELGYDPQSVAQSRYDLLTAQARRGEERMFNTLQNRLFAQGRLGSTGGGTAMKALFDSQAQADLGRQLAAQDLGLTTQRQVAGLASGFAGDAATRAAGRFDLARGLLGTGLDSNTARIGQANQLQSHYTGMFDRLMEQARLGQATAGANPVGAAMTLGADRERNDAYIGAFAPLGRMLGDKIADRWGGLQEYTPIHVRRY